jgi:hypothetical protein
MEFTYKGWWALKRQTLKLHTKKNSSNWLYEVKKTFKYDYKVLSYRKNQTQWL